MMRRGFTIVELIITITIMGILLTVAVVNLNATQVNARDAERKGDIEAIQLNLEDYYKSGGETGANIGYYPSTDMTGTSLTMRQTLRDINIESLKAPGIDDPTATFKPAANAVQTLAGVEPKPTIDQYIYQPISTTGSLCTGAGLCRKYNIFYRLEGDNVIYMTTSKHQ